jgi:hypothetical protein
MRQQRELEPQLVERMYSKKKMTKARLDASLCLLQSTAIA